MKGKIKENEIEFIIDFSTYNYLFKINKNKYKEAVKLNFHGYFHEIDASPGDSAEDYFEIHKIVLRSKLQE